MEGALHSVATAFYCWRAVLLRAQVTEHLMGAIQGGLCELRRFATWSLPSWWLALFLAIVGLRLAGRKW